MPDRPSNRQRRKHLKNLRKIQKVKRSQTIHPRSFAAVSSKGNPFVVPGLVASSAVLLLFLGSLFFQYKGSLPSGADNTKSGKTPIVEPAAVEVRVLNGCGVPGASRRMTQHLRDLQFDVVAMENAEHFNYQNTVVINHTNRPEIGRAMAEALDCSRLSMQKDDLALVDLTVILGKDWEKFLSSSPQKGEKKGVTGVLKEKLERIKEFLGL
jgi:hypothetical protein